MAGKVYLIGAGPGDAGLLTVKAAELLEKAEVLVYDRLVSDEILAKIPETVEKINVGKNVGNHPVPQDEINKILLDKALEGKMVVRLKGGDPFVFGRGGEELELLVENHISFEVVPGITSAIAVATYAGIPVTHRDFCSSLHIITGHTKKDGLLTIDYDSLVKLNGTLIFMMSVSTISEIANGLILAGMTPSMPIAVIENGTRPYQRKFISTIDKISKVIEENSVKSPSVIVVGKVCTLSEKFDWFSKLPLKDCKVLITRPTQTAGKLSSKLGELGADVTEIPCVKTENLNFDIDLETYRWIVFTSAVGVNAFFEKLYEKGLDARFLYNKKVAVVGTATEAELLNYGIRADIVPSVFDSKHLALELIKHIKKDEKVILYRAKNGSNEIINIFEENNISFTDIPVYQTLYIKWQSPHYPEKACEKGDITSRTGKTDVLSNIKKWQSPHYPKEACEDADITSRAGKTEKFPSIKGSKINIENFDFVCFTSASAVTGFVNSVENNVDYAQIKAVCIGEQTAKEAKIYGMNTIVSETATILSMVDKIKEIYYDTKT